MSKGNGGVGGGRGTLGFLDFFGFVTTTFCFLPFGMTEKQATRSKFSSAPLCTCAFGLASNPVIENPVLFILCNFQIG